MKLRIPPSQCALLVIDMQNGFVHPESGMGRSPSGTAAQRQIVEPILALIARLRARNIPIMWSQQEHFAEDRTRADKTIKPHSVKQGFLPCLRGTWETELYGPLRAAAQPGDHFVQKHRASVFFNTNLETKLRMLGTRFLLIAGCNTEFCVESTVRDAYARDFEIVVVEDCVAGIRPQFHQNALAVIRAYFGEVMPAHDLEACLYAAACPRAGADAAN